MADAMNFDEAERAALGALVTDAELLRRIPRLRPEHFAEIRHRLIFAAIVDLLADTDGVVDHMTILDRLRTDGHLARVGGAPYLHTLIEACPVAANIAYYAKLVLDHATRRRVAEIGATLQQIAAGPDLAVVTENALAIRDTLGELVGPGDLAEEPIVGLTELAEFVDSADEPYDWVIPGLLERMDRVIVVASEGAGKSTLGRQVAMMVGQGVHPFVPTQPIPAKRTLVVDLENPPALIRRKSRYMVDRLRGWGTFRQGQTWMLLRPGGINLRKAADVAMLDRVMSEIHPQLVCLGPLYKAAIGGGDSGEQVAGDVAFALDRLRERHRVALWLEAHAPLEQMGHRNLRPFGSGLWSRWPEFGLSLYKDPEFALNKTVKVERFRGDRDERVWPEGLRWGRTWPWDPIWPDNVPPPFDPPRAGGP